MKAWLIASLFCIVCITELTWGQGTAVALEPQPAITETVQPEWSKDVAEHISRLAEITQSLSLCSDDTPLAILNAQLKSNRLGFLIDQENSIIDFSLDPFDALLPGADMALDAAEAKLGAKLLGRFNLVRSLWSVGCAAGHYCDPRVYEAKKSRDETMKLGDIEIDKRTAKATIDVLIQELRRKFCCTCYHNRNPHEVMCSDPKTEDYNRADWFPPYRDRPAGQKWKENCQEAAAQPQSD